MISRMKWLVALAAFGAATASMAQVSSDRVLLVVNGEQIKGDQYYRRMEVLPNVGKLAGTQFVAETPGFLTLQTIVNEILMVQLAKKENVYPTEAEINADIARRKRLAPESYEAFIQAGFSDADFRYEALVQMCEFKIFTKGVNVTDFEVNKYYTDNPRKFIIPKRFVLRTIVVQTPAAQNQVDDALKAGESFAEVAAKYSLDVSKASGGMLGEVAEEQLGSATHGMITQSKKGDITPWIKAGDSFVRFQVDDIKDGGMVPLDDNTKAEIRRQIMLDKGLPLQKFTEKMNEMRRTARFEFQGTPFDDKIKKLFQGG